MIKAVIFDFGQTLVDSAHGFRAAEKEAQVRLYPDFETFPWPTFLTAYREIRSAYHAQSIFSRAAIWQELYRRLACTPDLDLLEKFEIDYWHTVKIHSRLFPEVSAVLETLARNYRVALITNTQGQKAIRKHRLSQFPELEKYFETIVVAGECGVPAKPDPAPFKQCLAKLGLAAPEAVYVGDDWRIDVCGAGDVGMHPIWLQHETVRRRWPAVETTVPIITRLDPLLDLDRLLGRHQQTH